MLAGLRKSGLDIIGDVPWATHFCQFYQTADDLLDTLVPYFRTGLESNEFCMWITADPVSTEQARRAMAKAMPHFNRYLQKGQIEILPHSEWYLKDGYFNSERVLNKWIDKLNEALSNGYDGLRLTGNTFWLEKKDWKDFTNYEAAINNVIGKYQILALCTYCLDKCNALEILDVLRNHEFAVIKQEGKWELVENSKHKATREALIKSEDQFRKLYLTMNEGVAQHAVVYDTAGKAIEYVLTDFNPAYESITGFDRDESIGKKGSELYGSDKPPYLDICAETAATGKPAVFETYFSPKGRYFRISVFSPEKGKFVTVFSDITERKKSEEELKESEEKFKLITTNTPDHLLVQDANLRYTLVVNPQLGLSEKDMIGKTDFDILSREDAINLTRIKRKVIETGTPENVTVPLVSSNGDTQYFEGTYLPRRNLQGQIDGILGYFRNVTERMKMEEELQKLAAVVRHSKELVNLATPDGKMIFLNEAGAEMLGIDPEKVERLHITDVIPDHLKEKALNEVLPMLMEHGNWAGDLQYLNLKTGKLMDMHATTFTITDPKTGVLLYLANVSHDITERKQAEEQIRSLARFPSENPNPVLRVTKDNRVVYANEASLPLLDFWQSQIGGSLPVEYGKIASHSFTSNSDISVEVDCRGQIFALTFAPIVEAGDINIYGQDITELKRMEEALREISDYLNNLLDYANAPIVVWDPRFRITRFNHAFERLTGRSAAKAVGKKLGILFPKERMAQSLEEIRRAVAGEQWEVVEIPVKHTDGTVHTVLWNSANICASDGKTVVATIAQGQDITERKRVEEEVKRLNESLLLRAAELETANRELESFAYSVSHDLRAPLRSMEGFSLAVLEDYAGKLDDTGKDYLKRIQAASQLMGQLIDDMLRLSRVSRTEMKRQSVNLSEMANSIIAVLRETEPGRRVKVTIAPEMRVRGDTQLLQVALENLIQNAWKFTGKNTRAKIEVSASEREGKKTYFVRDNGAGFDMAYADKLFRPFQRLHSASEFPGTGIGLATVQRIINRHGGQVWAEAEMGKGATVYFTIP